MTRQVITPRFVLRPQRCTTTRCDTAPTMTLRRDASPASPGRRPAIAGSSTPPSALLSRRMNCGHKLHLPPNALFQSKHGVDGDIGQIQVFVAVFGSRCWTDDYAVKGCALLWSFIDHPVGLLPGKFAIIAKKGTSNSFPLSIAAVL